MKCLYLVALILISCGVPKNNQKAQKEGYSYEVGGESVAIDFDSKPAALVNAIDLQVRVNDKIFDFTLSSETGLQSIDGHSAMLSPEERNALAQAALDYSKDKAIGDSSSLETNSAFLAFDYLSQSPDNYIFPARSYSSQNLVNEGVRCIKKGVSIKAEWSTRTSARVAEDLLVGVNLPNNYGCMGRCGADCGWGGPSAWTKDCLDHDACSYRNNASGGSSDPNCGDEFNEAADDWMSGVIAGCNGK